MRQLAILGMVVFVAPSAFEGPGPATAKDKAEQVQKASDIVVQTLQREAREEVLDRRELLQAALEAAPDHPPARWQSGFVFDAKHREWENVDDIVSRGAKDDALARYRDMRAKAPDTIPGQLELARWCADRKLEDQARAHLSRVLDFEPDHAQARQLLGFMFINGTWVSHQEIEAVQVLAEEVGHRSDEMDPATGRAARRLGTRRSAARTGETRVGKDPGSWGGRRNRRGVLCPGRPGGPWVCWASSC